MVLTTSGSLVAAPSRTLLTPAEMLVVERKRVPYLAAGSGGRHHGIAGRIGGDEFALWVAGDAPVEVADKIVAQIAAAFDGQAELSVGVSVGVAPTLRDLSDALEAADRALYKAKSAGRGRAQLYDEPQELVV